MSVSVISPMSSNFCIREHAHAHIAISIVSPRYSRRVKECTTLRPTM